MIDIHCHILPDVDDGPKSWDVSLEMCRMAAADGITHIVATPHSNDRYTYDREAHTATLDRLRALNLGIPELSLGCDFHLSYDNLQDVLATPERYTINGSRYLLVELSDYGIPMQIADCFRLVQTQIGVLKRFVGPVLRSEPAREMLPQLTIAGNENRLELRQAGLLVRGAAVGSRGTAVSLVRAANHVARRSLLARNRPYRLTNVEG